MSYCNSTNNRGYERFGNRWQYTYILCRSCNLVYQSTRPKYDSEFIRDAYEFYAAAGHSNIIDIKDFFELASKKMNFCWTKLNNTIELVVLYLILVVVWVRFYILPKNIMKKFTG